MKKIIQLGVGCAISATMMYLAFKDLDIEKLKESFSAMTLWPFLPFVALFVVHFLARSLRWRLLLPSLDHGCPPVRKLFDAIMLGNLASFILPLRLGEFIRPLLLSRWSGYSFASSFISVVIERFFDLSGVLIAFALVVPLLPELPEWATLGAYSLGILALALLTFLIAGCLFPKFIRSAVGMLVSPLPSGLARFVGNFANDLLAGAAVIKTPSRLLGIIGLTGVVWLTTFLQFYVLLFIFPLEQHSILLGVTLGVFVALAVALPSAPGFVGVFQMGCVAGMSLFAYPVAAAQVYSIMVHLITFILIIAIGFWLLSVHDLNLFELKRAAERD